jgi:hypothetical protein
MHTKPPHAFEYLGLAPLISTFCRRASKVSVTKTVMLKVVKMVVVMAAWWLVSGFVCQLEPWVCQPSVQCHSLAKGHRERSRLYWSVDKQPPRTWPSPCCSDKEGCSLSPTHAEETMRCHARSMKGRPASAPAARRRVAPLRSLGNQSHRSFKAKKSSCVCRKRSERTRCEAHEEPPNALCAVDGSEGVSEPSKLGRVNVWGSLHLVLDKIDWVARQPVAYAAGATGDE